MKGRLPNFPPMPSLATLEKAPTQPPRWVYQWEDSLNGVSPPEVKPLLQARIILELTRLVLTGTDRPLVFVRGELGIGKSTLCELLRAELVAAGTSAADPRIGNALLTTVVLEAEDLESPVEFATRVKRAQVIPRPAVILARPGTIEAAAQWIGSQPDGTLTMRSFEPDGALFTECLGRVCDAVGVEQAARQQVSELAKLLPAFLQTPFYFQELANVVRVDPSASNPESSPLRILERSLDLRTGSGAFDALLECALARRAPSRVKPIAGIIDEGGFVHDGYRNVILASSVIAGTLPFAEMIRVRNAVPAVKVVLDHVEHDWRAKALDHEHPLIRQLTDTVLGVEADAEVPYLIFVQGLVASTLARLGASAPAEGLRTRCMRLVASRGVSAEEDQWWDVSDALSLVGDDRLRGARESGFGKDTGYFTHVPETVMVIGSDFVPRRSDDAKPVLPFRRGPVTVGPLWVANFLVTNELFAAFWASPDVGQYFRGAGAAWFNREPAMVGQIDTAFRIAARRCFWKEVKEQQTVRVSGFSTGSLSVLEIARDRAIRQSRVQLWDPTQADDRFSAGGNPVVGVNWWEAMAFCEWWTETQLDGARFPLGSRACLLTDWEWEALRRYFYDPELADSEACAPARYRAHLRSPSSTGPRRGRLTNIMRPLHVGLTPVPAGPGPFDLVGNVWEWTRSRVFGRIVETSDDQGAYGATGWDDGDDEAERTPMSSGRDVIDEEGDLAYRAVRGASFFSIDEQAAWHPAYRLCDPPFSSYFDLGFRIAVYPGLDNHVGGYVVHQHR